jgi:hypothetical protein
MSRGAVLALKITGDSRDGVRALDDVDGASGRAGGALGKLAAGAGAALGALAVLGKAGFDAAAALEQSTGGVTAVFGDWAIDIEQAAAGADRALGLSKNSYQELATVLGSQLKNAGMNIGDVTAKTQELIGKGADMAAVFGGTTADAVSALSSALKGEMDPIERYGVSLNQSAIDAKLAAMGLDGLEGSAAQAAKTQAVLALVNEQSAQTMGAAAAESDTAASKMGQLSAMWENGKAALGEKLLPVFVDAATFVQDKVVPAIEKLTEKGGPLATIFAQVGAFIKDELLPTLQGLYDEFAPKLIPIMETVGNIITQHVVPAFQTVWQFVQDYVIPIFKTVLSPALDGVQSAWGKVSDALDRNKDKFSAIYENLKPFFEFLRDKLAPFVGGALKRGFEVLGDVIGAVIDSVAWILEKGSQVMDFLFGASSAGDGRARTRSAGAPVGGARVFGAAPGGLFGASSPLVVGSGGLPAGGQGFQAAPTYVTVKVDGFVGSSVQLADAIARALDERARRTGALPAFGGVRIA